MSKTIAENPPLRYNRNPNSRGLSIMKIAKDTIALDEITQMAVASFGDLVKAVVDVDREVIAFDAELHSDLEALLLEDGSRQNDLWGINLYPKLQGEGFIEFDSVINMRPTQGNRSRGVDNLDIRNKIEQIVMKRVKQ